MDQNHQTLITYGAIVVQKQAAMSGLVQPHNQNWHLWTSLATLILGLLAFCSISFFQAQRTPLFFTGFVLSFCGMLGLRHTWPPNWKLMPLVLIAIIARCFLLPLEHTDDLNRYLWEGKVQLHAINPYAIAPIDKRTEPFRDAVWQGINHK